MNEQEHIDAVATPELKAFLSWCSARTVEVGNFLKKAWEFTRTLGARLGQQAWRPYYCWIFATINLLALKAAFYDLPMQHVFLPEYMMYALLMFTVLVLVALGIRTFEKIQFGQLAIEQTNRLNADNANADA